MHFLPLSLHLLHNLFRRHQETNLSGKHLLKQKNSLKLKVYQNLFVFLFVCLFVFVALRPMSTAMVIAGRSVHLTTLFPGQA